MTAIDINCDMGESFGRWSLGDDLGMMPYLSSVNIATGYHAGDPPTIRRTVANAVEHELAIGAHIAFPDLMGFGRRRMVIPPRDLEDYCLYQIGALDAIVRAAGSRLSHVKPHGALYVMASEDAAVAAAVARAVASFDRTLPLLLLNRQVAEVVDVIEEQGLVLVPEAFPDLHYTATGGLIIEPTKLAWEPDLVAGRALDIIERGWVLARDDSVVPVEALSLCLHGDAPNGVEVARTVHRQLSSHEIAIVPLAALLGSSSGSRTQEVSR